MPLVVKDRVKETTTTTGTGTLTLAGAVTGFQAFSVIGDGNTTYYTIVGVGSSEFEVGVGTYTLSGTTLSRDTILESSNSGSAVNFSAGSKEVFVTYPAERAVYTDAAGAVITPATASTLGISSGGTGETTASNAINALLPSQTGNSGEYLTTNGSVASWDAVPSPNNGTLTMGVSGTGLSGSASFTADQAGGSTFTVTSNATNANTANTIVARDGSGNFSAGTITAALSGNATTSSSTTGNAATATALQNDRTIGGVSFNGTANINLPGVNAAGNQNTSGTAASAATWTTARTITVGATGKSVDGSGNVSYSANEITGQSGSAPHYFARAWVNFNGTGTVAIRASANVSSITDNGTGDFTVNFSTAMPSANYSVVGTSMRPNTNLSVLMIRGSATYADGITASSVRLNFRENTNAVLDPLAACIATFN